MANRTVDVPALAAAVRQGHIRAVGRAISIVEDDAPQRDALLQELAGADEGAASGTGGGAGAARSSAGADRAAEGASGPRPSTTPRTIGITGPPGAGKSTLINAMVRHLRGAGEKVAVLAVDPSSPFSGGALLGDRIRMNAHSLDTGVYIRSMAARGHHGGLSAASYDAATILTRAGFDSIILESVGVGQSEVGILALADVTLVVLNPNAGDDVQTLKAGVMEIGDIYVINKVDLAGATELERYLKQALPNPMGSALKAEIAKTAATEDTGIAELLDTIRARLAALNENGELTLRRRRRTTAAVEDVAIAMIRQWLRTQQQEGREASPLKIRRRLDELLRG